MLIKNLMMMMMMMMMMMDDLRFYVLFNNISVISDGLVGDPERLCAMEPHLPELQIRGRIEDNSKIIFLFLNE